MGHNQKPNKTGYISATISLLSIAKYSLADKMTDYEINLVYYWQTQFSNYPRGISKKFNQMNRLSSIFPVY